MFFRQTPAMQKIKPDYFRVGKNKMASGITLYYIRVSLLAKFGSFDNYAMKDIAPVTHLYCQQLKGISDEPILCQFSKA